MNDERAHVAMPKLYGAPAYARPPVVPVAPVERPFDPDDLPLEADRTREEDDLATHLQAHPYASVASGEAVHGKSGMLRGRRLRLRLPGSSHHAR